MYAAKVIIIINFDNEFSRCRVRAASKYGKSQVESKYIRVPPCGSLFEYESEYTALRYSNTDPSIPSSWTQVLVQDSSPPSLRVRFMLISISSTYLSGE
jgi:hypothetical protein